ncbi:bifunctional diguanylate cyclase/phosphodiesterase [Halomonas sp. YLGW01]|uniref:putative bifunctional diguanylate cyclase/phosphodiesterase n=1 Tax=Halomonas sp. YLGW01 TaxID=2773308 RepID=UPI001786259B|nr:bifunctional diguanylate cyclase/phosphodiesterase [Halomonas sp. YLGW01]
MDLNNRALLRQAGLLVLLTISLMLALIGLLEALLPSAPLPPRLQASLVGSLLLLLATLVLGVLCETSAWRGRLRSPLARGGGVTALLLGAMALASLPVPGVAGQASPIIGLGVFLLGSVLLGVPARGAALPPLRPATLVVSAVGIGFSIALWCLTRWSLHLQRGDVAAEFAAFTGLVEVLPAGIGLLGFGLTYLWIVSLALMDIRAAQTRALANSEQRFRSLFTQNPDAVLSMDLDGIHRSVNPATQAIIGVEAKAILGRSLEQVLSPEAVSRQDLAWVATAFEAAKSGQVQHYALDFRPLGQANKCLDVRLLPIVIEGKVEGVYGIIKDVTQHQRDLERLHVLERSLEASSNGVIIFEATRGGYSVVYVNPAFTRVTGYPAEEVLGRSSTFLEGPETDPHQAVQIQAALDRGEGLTIVIRHYRRDGRPFWNQLFISPVHDERGQVTHFIGIMDDITERKDQEARLAHHANHDALTGLANRALLHDRLQQGLALARRHGQVLAVLFIDLDEFKPINDSLGHAIGDQLLISVTRCLSRGLRPSDTLARLGGDEFVLLLPDLHEPSEASRVAERLLRALEAPHRVRGHELYLSASIGISVCDDAGEAQVGQLIQQADMAMYEAKQQGRNTYHRFSADLDSRLSQRVILRNELQEAITQGQLTLHYQPLLDAAGRVHGLEALVRWQHPTKGAISPGDFIYLAEETGQIVPLSQWVMGQVCRDALELLARGLLPGRVAVNLSTLEFHRADFLAGLRATLEASGLSPAYLELELTENMLMRDTEAASELMHALHELGVSTAIDDFGTGFSSLSHLRYLPMDKIKIDRSFICDVTDNTRDAAVCQSVITLAKELELRVVAEGIETTAQHDYLARHGCELFQGYLLARPMPLGRLIPWLSERRVPA